MYDFHYNFIKEKCGSKAKLLFTDTDSLTFEIQAKDVYKDFLEDREKFDNNDYGKDNEYFDGSNKKVIGKFKDEAAIIPITEFTGLRSKMYSYVKDVIKTNIAHQDYKDTPQNNKQIYHTMKTIRGVCHQLGSYELNKVSLSCFDDKRYIHANGQTSYAYGHYKIKK